MMDYRVRLLMTLLDVMCLCGCAYVGALQEWNPGRVNSDAARDIAAGKVRLYRPLRFACSRIVGRIVPNY